MIKATVRLENIDGFDAQLQEVISAVDANLDEVANVVFEEAKHSAGFADKTGNLRKSIKKRKSKFEDGGYIVSASGKGKERGHHAHLVEFGHAMMTHYGKPTKKKRVPPHPFMRPALEIGIVKAVELFRSKK